VLDDALVQAATAAEVGLVQIAPDGQVWWSDETYRLHGRPRWRRVRTLDDIVAGVPADVAPALLTTYAAALSNPDVDLRYSVVGANGERRDLVLRAIDDGLAVVHRAGADAERASGDGSVVDVRDRTLTAPPLVDDEPVEDDGLDDDSDARVSDSDPGSGSVDSDRALGDDLDADGADDAATAEPDTLPGSPEDLDLAAAVLSATPDLVLLYDIVAHRFVSMAGNDDDVRAVVERLRHGGALSDDVHPDDLTALAAWRDDLHTLTSGETRHIDVRMRHEESWRWSEARASEFRRDTDGELEEVVLIVRDVHERVEAAHRVAESERAFREVFDASPVGLAVLDDHGRFTDVNDAFCLLVGHTRDAVLATVYEALLHPGDRAAAVIARARHVSEGTPASSSERRLTRADGATIWVRVRTSDIDYNGDTRTLVSLEDVTASKATEDRLRHDALHDELTGLPNRRLITDRVELALTRARRAGTRVALFFIDLDDLKRVNDTHAWQHRAGDVLLTTVAERVRDSLREADTLGRLGGDEFVAVCEDVGGDDSVRDVGERILAAVCRPLSIGSETVAVGVSIGVAVTDDDDEDAAHLLRRADAAMYIAKAGGGSRVARADTGPLDVPAGADLVGALARRELRLLYQPVVSLSTGAVLGVNGALRWDDPQRGPVPAHEMRSALGAGAATLPVVHWCLDRAIADVRTVAPTRAEHVSVWLPVPGRAALASSTRDAVVASIAGPDGRLTADTAPSLVLDVHEGDVASLTKRQALHRHLDDLLAVGPLALGVEHFTADLVPVGMLQLLTAASVSLDPDLLASVSENRSTEELLRALVAAASALGVVTIAMDVHTQEHLQVARSLGVHAAYGDVIGPAAPLDSYADLLHHGHLELPGMTGGPAYDRSRFDAAGFDAAGFDDAGFDEADDLETEPTDLALDLDDDGPSDADIWAGVLGTLRAEPADAVPLQAGTADEPTPVIDVAPEPEPGPPPDAGAEPTRPSGDIAETLARELGVALPTYDDLHPRVTGALAQDASGVPLFREILMGWSGTGSTDWAETQPTTVPPPIASAPAGPTSEPPTTSATPGSAPDQRLPTAPRIVLRPLDPPTDV
jgi:diguanylate cyclase (GGDEF)-like protein/PAS domain S-box-containing protein